MEMAALVNAAVSSDPRTTSLLLNDNSKNHDNDIRDEIEALTGTLQEAKKTNAALIAELDTMNRKIFRLRQEREYHHFALAVKVL